MKGPHGLNIIERNLNLHIFFSNTPQFWQDLGSIYCLHGVEPSRDMEIQKTAHLTESLNV